MTIRINFLVMVSMIVLLGGGLIICQADDQSGSSDIKKTPSDLTGADRDLYQQFVSVISSDPDYNRLGYSDEEFRYLTTKSDCFILALNVRNPDVSSSGELETLGRPQLEMVTQINELEGYRGTLMNELTYNANLDSNLNSLAGYIKSFYEAFSQGSSWGIFKTFLQIGGEKLVIKPLSDQMTNHSFNRLYQAYKQARDDKTPEAAFDSINDVTGPNWGDMKTIVSYYTDKNDKAKLGWSPETINGLVGRYLEDRYKTDNNMAFNPWEVPVFNPEDAMENQFRDALHAIKLQNKYYLRMLTEPCVHEMPSGTTPEKEQSNIKGGKGELVLDHLDAIATKYWNEGEGGTYIIFNKTNVDRRQKSFEAENDSSWNTGHFNMKLTTDIDLPDKIPIDNYGRYSFNGSVKASASWDSSGLGLSRSADLDINGLNKGSQSGIENRQATLNNQSETNYSGELGSSDEKMVADFNSDAVTHVEGWVNPSIEIDIHAVYKLQNETQSKT